MCDGYRMSDQNPDSSHDGLRFMKNTQLPQDCSSVIVDPFTRKTIPVVERINCAKRYFNSPSGCGKTAPGSKMSSANQNFQDNVVVRHMLLPNFDFEVRQCRHETFIVGTNSIGSR